MQRYIDAERFSERFDMMCDAGGVLAPVTKAVREMVKELIKAEPTADVEPVRHGLWIQSQTPAIWYCSVCGERIHYNTTPRTYQIEKPPVNIVNARCRKCGAKMDGGERGAV